MASNTAEMIFKITADGGNAEAGLARIQKHIEQLGGSSAAKLQSGFHAAASEASNLVGIFTGDRLTGATSQLTSLAGAVNAIPGPVGLAVGAIAGLGTLAVGVIGGLSDIFFKVAESTAHAGAGIEDFATKTSLSASTASALSFAAEKSGTSLEALTKGFNRFNVELGKAQQGDQDQIDKLKKIGITSFDTDKALGQLIDRIRSTKSEQVQMAIASEALGKKAGPELVTMIRQGGESLDEMKKKVKELGIGFSDEGAAKAKELDDSLKTLNAQFQGLEIQIGEAVIPAVLELVSAVSSVMAEISHWIQNNQETWDRWSTTIMYIAAGVGEVLKDLASDIGSALLAIDSVLNSSGGAWAKWAEAGLLALNPLLYMVEQIIKGLYIIGKAKEDATHHEAAAVGISPPDAGDGGGGGGKKGRSGKDPAKEAERERKKQVQEEEKDNRLRAESYKAYLTQQSAALDLGYTRQLQQYSAFLDAQGKLDRAGEKSAVTAKTLLESEFIKRKGNLAVQGLEFDKQLLQHELNNVNLNEEEKHAIQVKMQVLDYQIKTEKLKTEKELREAEEKETEAIRQLNEKEKERLELIKKQRAQAALSFSQWQLQQRQQMDPLGVGRKKKGAGGDGVDWAVSGGGKFLTGLVGKLGAANEQMSKMEQLGSALADVFTQVGQAVGEAAKNFVLLGSAGTSFKKFAAEVIASIAQMAVVQAISEAAQGAAMLGLAWFTGNPKFAKSAGDHFWSAAMWGMVAGVAIPAGRAVAGNSFKDASGGSGGGGSSSATQNNSPYSRTSGNFDSGTRPGQRAGNFFADSQAKLAASIQSLSDKIDTARPGDVFIRGMKANRGEVVKHVIGEIGSDGSQGAKLLKVSGMR